MILSNNDCIDCMRGLRTTFLNRVHVVVNAFVLMSSVWSVVPTVTLSEGGKAWVIEKEGKVK